MKSLRQRAARLVGKYSRSINAACAIAVLTAHCASPTSGQRRALSSKKSLGSWLPSNEAPSGAAPRYSLSGSRMPAVIRNYVEARQRNDEALQRLSDPITLQERNCLACHARGESPGLESQLTVLLQRHPQLAATADLLLPPTLETIGVKWLSNELQSIIQRPFDHRRRSWLSVRMPQYVLQGVRKSWTNLCMICNQPMSLSSAKAITRS